MEENKRLAGQLRTLSTCGREVLRGFFGKKEAADRLLAAWFRANPRCGSRDRALLSDAVCSLLRSWGFWRSILPAERREEIESGSIRLSERELAGLFCAASFTMAMDHAVTAACVAKAELPVPRAAGDFLARAQECVKLFGSDRKLHYSDLLPEELLEELPSTLPPEALGEFLLHRAPLWLRIQQESSALQNDLAAYPLRRPEKPQNAASLTGARIHFSAMSSYQQGDFEIQDLGSQCIGLVCAPRPGERWYDPCAGAGGKTLQLASLMKRRGEICAGDIRDWKLEELRRRARRAGFPNIRTRAHDGTPWSGKHPYDGVLVDAPCSGSGVWRRNPGGQWLLLREQIAQYAEKQFRILCGNARAVRQGGVLVYATCSLFPAENEAVVRRFLAAVPDFKLDPFDHPLTGASCPGMMQVNGIEHDCDFLFAARFRRFGA